MDSKVADALIDSLLQRIARDGFRLVGSLSQLEREAILRKIGPQPSASAVVTPVQQPATKSEKRVPRKPAPVWKLDPGCLSSQPQRKPVVGIDFGTAFSKASLWRKGNRHPTPLDLSRSATGGHGVLLESTLYIDADQIIQFGPKAIEASRSTSDLSRRRFDSPKQILSIAGVEGLSTRAETQVDPAGVFTNRDLLTLYLAYLTAMICDQLQRLGINRHVTRRFAVPVWSASQVEETSRILTQMLVDAQILADSVPLNAWNSGIDANAAKGVLEQLRSKVTDTDERRKKSKLVERHVLEAAAAASAIGDQLENRRPVAVVMDIGAGTTDIGIYHFVFPSNRSGIPPKISALKGGAIAKKIAGDRLDDLLLEFIRRAARLNEGDAVLFRTRRDIRDIKQRFFSAGRLRVEGLDDLEFKLNDFVQGKAVQNYRSELRRALEDLLASVGVGNIYREDGVIGVLTGGGSAEAIFGDFFDHPFSVSGQLIKFRRLRATPKWLHDLDPAYAAVFPQLAVALGVSSENLPDETSPITCLPNSDLRVLGLAPMYRS